MNDVEVFNVLQFVIEVVLIPILFKTFSRLRTLERSIAVNDEQHNRMSCELHELKEEMFYLRSWFTKFHSENQMILKKIKKDHGFT